MVSGRDTGGTCTCWGLLEPPAVPCLSQPINIRADEACRIRCLWSVRCMSDVRSLSGLSGWPQLGLSVLAEELAMIKEAIFTEPDDQSPWFYHRWLISQLCTPGVRMVRGAADTSDTGSTADTPREGKEGRPMEFQGLGDEREAREGMLIEEVEAIAALAQDLMEDGDSSKCG